MPQESFFGFRGGSTVGASNLSSISSSSTKTVTTTSVGDSKGKMKQGKSLSKLVVEKDDSSNNGWGSDSTSVESNSGAQSRDQSPTVNVPSRLQNSSGSTAEMGMHYVFFLSILSIGR